MGAIDLVVQIESPPSVASGMQRIGRAGHQVGEPSTGKIFPKFRGDLVEAAVVVERMKAAAIEETRIPRNPLDVLAQQLVAICAHDRWTVDDLHRLVTRAESFRDLSREQLTGVLDMLSGRYPSDEFADLKPRVVWDRQTDEVASRNDARVVAITSGGTIPDRGLFGVFLPGDDGGRGGRRVGEMDEEMGLRVAGWRDLPARGLDVAHRGDPSRSADRHARARRAGQDAVLARRRDRAADRARTRHRRLPARARADGARGGDGAAARLARPRRACGAATWWATSPISARSPACCRPIARSWSSASGTSSATGGSRSSRHSAAASTRRGRWPSRLGCASITASTCRPCGRTTASRSGCPRGSRPMGRRSNPRSCSVRTRSRSC